MGMQHSECTDVRPRLGRGWGPGRGQGRALMRHLLLPQLLVGLQEAWPTLELFGTSGVHHFRKYSLGIGGLSSKTAKYWRPYNLRSMIPTQCNAAIFVITVWKLTNKFSEINPNMKKLRKAR